MSTPASATDRVAATATVSAAALLAVVQASPELVAVHDRAAWLDLFAPDGVVEDPVGSAPYRKSDGDRLGQFYDTFIAPNDIRFDVRRDIVVQGAAPEVVREVQILSRLSSGLEVAVDAHLRYELCVRSGQIKIQRMSAMWELGAASLKTMTGGLKGLVEMCGMTARMLRHQGVGGMLGYSKALVLGIGGTGRRAVRSLEAGTIGREAFSPDARIEILPEGEALTPERWRAWAGDGVRFAQITAAGWAVSCSFEAANARGLAFFDFDPLSKTISGARFYCEGA